MAGDYIDRPTQAKTDASNLERMKRQLADSKVYAAKLEAAISFLEANPGAQALIDLMR